MNFLSRFSTEKGSNESRLKAIEAEGKAKGHLDFFVTEMIDIGKRIYRAQLSPGDQEHINAELQSIKKDYYKITDIRKSIQTIIGNAYLSNLSPHNNALIEQKTNDEIIAPLELLEQRLLVLDGKLIDIIAFQKTPDYHILQLKNKTETIKNALNVIAENGVATKVLSDELDSVISLLENTEKAYHEKTIKKVEDRIKLLNEVTEKIHMSIKNLALRFSALQNKIRDFENRIPIIKEKSEQGLAILEKLKNEFIPAICQSFENFSTQRNEILAEAGLYYESAKALILAETQDLNSAKIAILHASKKFDELELLSNQIITLFSDSVETAQLLPALIINAHHETLSRLEDIRAKKNIIPVFEEFHTEMQTALTNILGFKNELKDCRDPLGLKTRLDEQLEIVKNIPHRINLKIKDIKKKEEEIELAKAIVWSKGLQLRKLLSNGLDRATIMLFAGNLKSSLEALDKADDLEKILVLEKEIETMIKSAIIASEPFKKIKIIDASTDEPLSQKAPGEQETGTILPLINYSDPEALM